MRRAIALAMLLAVATASPAMALAVLQTIPVGPQPFGLAFAGGSLYVANNGSSTVSIIDTATNAVTGTIAVGSGPGEIVTDPAAGRAYVGNFNDGTVSVVDLATRSTIATLAPGGLGVAVDPGLGRLYVTIPSQVTVFDTATLQPVAVIAAPAGASWWAIAVDPVRHVGYVADLSGGGVTVLDLGTNTAIARIDVGGPVRFALATDPARGMVFAATDTAPGRLAIIDAATNTVARAVMVGDFPSHIAPHSASAVYVSDLGSDDIAVVDPLTLVVTRVAVGSKPAGLTIVGSTPYVALNGAGAVAVLGERDSTPPVVEPVNTAPVVDRVAVSPGQPTTLDSVTATVGAHDADGDPLTYGYQWTRNGVDIVGATGQSLDLSAPGNGDRGDAIAVRVIASDGTSNSVPMTSATVAVGNTAPLATVALSTATPTTYAVLVASATASDADGDRVSFTYVWMVNGVTRRTTSTASTADSFDLGQPGNGNRGDVVTVQLTPTDGSLGAVVSASATIVAGRGR